MPSLYDSFLKGIAKSKQWQQQFTESQTSSKAFDDSFLVSAPEIFVQTKESNKLLEQIGERAGASIVAVIGPKRCGKSTAIHQAVKNINDHGDKQDDEDKKFRALYKSCDDNFAKWWEETDFSSTQFFFFDHIYPIWDNFNEQSFQDLLERSKQEEILIIVILDSIEHNRLETRFKPEPITIFGKNLENKKLLFNRPSSLEIEQIIKRRTDFIGRPFVFPREVLTTISIMSLGLPGLALWIARHLFSRLDAQDDKYVLSSSDVHKTAEYLGFIPALRLIMEHNIQNTKQPDLKIEYPIWPVLEPLKEAINEGSTTLLQYLTKIKGTTKSWGPILEEMVLLNHDSKIGAIKRSDLQERTGIKESSLTYQCQNLIKERIVNYSKIGREVFYELRSPIKEALELTFFG
ncbi:MAG: hypothetical protein ACW97X_05870 [Candidatus Hodarchaeales archaeon]